MRAKAFENGPNSFGHFICGILTIFYPWIMPLFLLYQLRDIHDINVPIDILEYYVGFILGMLYLMFFPWNIKSR